MKDKTKPPRTISVYVLTDPRHPNDVRYVGVTNTPKRRLRGHISKARTQANHRANWINSLVRDGLRPIMTIIDETDENNWRQCEIDWIAHYRATGCNLVNSTDGGDGCRGFIPTEETRKKLAEKSRGRTHTTETRQRLAEIQRTKKYSDESRHKMSESHKIPILQYNKFGHFIREWGGASEVESELGISNSNIIQCCRHNVKSAGGFVWCYADDPLLGEYPAQLKIKFDEE